MSTGSVATPDTPRGAHVEGRANFFCRDCRSFVVAPSGANSMRECPTLGCSRPTGFGAFATVPRPRPSSRTSPAR
ncbi:MAG TPA: hypothetical protein VGM13_06440 [Thermoanaerobaculia bacterium]